MSRTAIAGLVFVPSLALAGGSAPSEPVLVAPLGPECVRLNLPTLEVDGSIDPDGDSITYHFELDSDPGMRSLYLQESGGIPQDPDGPTRWRVARPLQDCSIHYWRVWASDGTLESERVAGVFETCVDDCDGPEGDAGPDDDAGGRPADDDGGAGGTDDDGGGPTIGDGADGSARRGGCSCRASPAADGPGFVSLALLSVLRRRR